MSRIPTKIESIAAHLAALINKSRMSERSLGNWDAKWLAPSHALSNKMRVWETRWFASARSTKMEVMEAHRRTSRSSSASLARMGQLMGRCPRRRSAETNQRSFVRPHPNDTCRLKSHDIQQPDANEHCRVHRHSETVRWKRKDGDATGIPYTQSAHLL